VHIRTWSRITQKVGGARQSFLRRAETGWRVTTQRRTYLWYDGVVHYREISTRTGVSPSDFQVVYTARLQCGLQEEGTQSLEGNSAGTQFSREKRNRLGEKRGIRGETRLRRQDLYWTGWEPYMQKIGWKKKELTGGIRQGDRSFCLGKIGKGKCRWLGWEDVREWFPRNGLHRAQKKILVSKRKKVSVVLQPEMAAVRKRISKGKTGRSGDFIRGAWEAVGWRRRSLKKGDGAQKWD